MFLQVNNSHVPALNEPMVLLTKYGREAVWTAAAALIFIFGGRVGRKTAVIIAIAMLVLIPTGSVVKEIVERPRPVIPSSDLLLAQDTDFSFPSGHAVIVSAGAAIALTSYIGTKMRMAVSLALTVEAALVCVSRVYVGGHYPLDVLGGILLGLGVAFIFIGFSERIDSLLQPLMKSLRLQS